MVMGMHDASGAQGGEPVWELNPSKGSHIAWQPCPKGNSPWGKCPAAATLIATDGPSEIVLRGPEWPEPKG